MEIIGLMFLTLMYRRCSLLLFFVHIVSAASDDVTLKRRISKFGFHRDLESTVVFPLSIKNQCDSTVMMMLENLPTGIYVDPFQVQGGQQFGGPQVTFDRSVDIEAAEFSSKEHKLKVFVDIDFRPTIRGALKIKIKLPIHARYHKPAQNPFLTDANVNILNPKLYLNCRLNDDADTGSHELIMPHNGTSYKWFQISYKRLSSNIVMKVPVGLEKDKPLVVVITLFVTVAVSAILCMSIIGCQDLEHCKMA